MARNFLKKMVSKVKRDNEISAKQSVLEELFYDFNRDRATVYKMNFFRGIFFGVGSAIGATVLITALIGLLSVFTDLPGGIGNFIQRIIEAMNQK